MKKPCLAEWWGKKCARNLTRIVTHVEWAKWLCVLEVESNVSQIIVNKSVNTYKPTNLGNPNIKRTFNSVHISFEKYKAMDYTPSKKRRIVNPELIALREAYPHDLQLYKIPPSGQISLMEFQDLALERQKILQLLEATLIQQHKTIEERKMAFTQALRKEGFSQFSKLINAQGCDIQNEKEELQILQARRRDHISHYILRLAYSVKDDLQKYMTTHEVELFKLRFSSLNKEGVTRFLATSGLHYTPISQEFKDEIRENLYASTMKDGDFENMNFYELPFDEVVDLISDRKVYLRKGLAYVPQTDLITVFVTHFKNHLDVELNNAKKFILKNLDDERLQNFLKSLPESYAGMAKVYWNSENTPISKLNDLSKTSYPLCMRIMHEHLTTNHHLRNTGRLQYGLFLKGIGVTMEDSIEFWRNEFTKKEDINEDKFNKAYLYQIKYNYGKMGRRVNYRPAGCNKLINDPVGSGEVHGCPYKHMDTDELTKKLNEYKLPPADIVEIANLAKEGHYILACTKYFEITHKRLPQRMFLHPNQYFVESRNILTKDETKEEEKVGNMDTSQVSLSPERISQTIKVKVDNNLSTISNSVTPSRSVERKVKPVDRKSVKMDPVNIEALLNEDD